MITRTSSIPVQVDGQQELVLQLQREDLGSYPLGMIGNLQFSVKQHGTAPAATHDEMLWLDQRRSMVDRRADVRADVTREPLQARAQREALTEARAQVRANSLLIGNLLGSLTAKVDEDGQFLNEDGQFFKTDPCSRIVQALIELNESGEKGGLYSLKGAKYCLDTYLEDLKEADLVALTSGALRNEKACKALLDSISSNPTDASRMQAALVLRDIAEAVNQQVYRHGMHKPLLQIVELLAAYPVNLQDLNAQLLALPDDRDAHARYFGMLPRDEFKRLLGARNSLDAVQQALRQTGAYWQADSLLGLGLSLESEFDRRVCSSLHIAQLKLFLVLRGGNRLVAPVALYCYSRVVEDTYQTWGALPKSSVQGGQQRVKESMDLLRDPQNNPDGPLNEHSLSKLDDGMRKNLGDAAQVLWAFGLELDPQLRIS